MKAIRAHEWCGPEGLVVEDLPEPEPGPGEVVVDVKAAALNFPDTLIIAGKYQVKPPLPYTPGFELAGTVAAVGEGADWLEVGQRVLAQVQGGAFAERCLCLGPAVRPIPESMSDEEAAVFPMVYQTAYFGLAERGALREGETVLVHSGAGGVGLAAVQLAKALGAGKVIATVGSDGKLDLVREHGADVAVNYRTDDFVDVVKRETGGSGADVIYDPVGGEVGERSTKCIAFEGRLVIIGFTSGSFSTFSSNHILVKNYSVVGLHWGNYQFHDPAKIQAAWDRLFELHAAGAIRPLIGARYPMERVGEAMDHLSSRRAVGKIVLHW